MKVWIPEPFLRMPSDKCRFEPTSACQVLILISSQKSFVTDEGRNAFDLAFESS
jgi:hypothetical protein